MTSGLKGESYEERCKEAKLKTIEEKKKSQDIPRCKNCKRYWQARSRKDISHQKTASKHQDAVLCIRIRFRNYRYLQVRIRIIN
jgi:hypothetical protein